MVNASQRRVANVTHKQNPELDELLERAFATFDAMTWEEKAEMHHNQRRSWVIGEMMMRDPKLRLEEAEAIYDKVRR